LLLLLLLLLPLEWRFSRGLSEPFSGRFHHLSKNIKPAASLQNARPKHRPRRPQNRPDSYKKRKKRKKEAGPWK